MSSAKSRSARPTSAWGLQGRVVSLGLLITSANAFDVTPTEVGSLAAQEPVRVVDAPPEARCEIEVRPEVTLGAPDDPVAISPISSMTRLPDGRFLVANLYEPGRVAVYDREGRLEGTFGREGEGPGEYGEIVGLSGGPGDSIFVWSRASVTVLDAQEFAVQRTARLEVRPRRAVLADDGRMLVTAAHTTPELIGFPVHLVDPDGGLERSFGEGAGEPVGIFNPIAEQRAMAAGRDHTVWLARQDRYRIEEWGLSGELRHRLERDVPWFPPDQDFQDPEAGWERPPRTNLVAIREDAAGRVWTLLNVPGTNWTPASRPVPGRMSEQEISRASRAFDIERRERDLDRTFELIDPFTGQVLGTRRVGELYLFGWLPHPYAFRHRERPDGYLELEVVRLECLPTGAGAD